MAALMRSFDWTSVGLPPADDWPESLKAVTRILLTSRYGMWMGWGRDLTFMYNDSYGEMTLGKKHPWALGKPAREVWAEIWGDLESRIRTVMETGEATWDEGLLLFLERSGYPEETYHTFSYSPVISADGTIEGMFCVVTEETERIIGERRLATLRDLAATLGSTVNENDVFAAIENGLGTNARDLPFTLTYAFDDEGAHARLLAATGIAPDHPAAPRVIDVHGTPLWPARELWDSPKAIIVDGLAERVASLPNGAWDRPPSQAVLVPIAQQGTDKLAGFMVAGLNRYRPLDTSYLGFVELVAGQIGASLANSRSYEAERRRAEALAELDRAKTAFFSNVSHELRTPLTLMMGPAEDALNEPNAIAENRERVSIIHRNALRLLKLVNTMLDFTRIEAGRVQASYEQTDFAAFVAEIASSFRSAMERAGLRFIVNAAPGDGKSAPVYLDRDMWEKIVLNLLSNAFKHTFEGEVEVGGNVRDGVATLIVRDSGVGIPSEQLPRIFERFHRVPNAKSRTHEGSGIGLALVQELVRLHEGRMTVESEVGEGTTFTVTMPAGSAHLPKDRIASPTASAATTIAHGVGFGGSTPFVTEALRWLPGDGDAVKADDESTMATTTAHVLVADDNADMREYVGRLLRAHGHRVTMVADGQAALDAALRELPNLILSDVMMPRLDGFELLDALRNNESTKDTPVILLSARAGEEARVEGMEAGATDYLAKPFSSRELLARVDSHLTRAMSVASERQHSRAQQRLLEIVQADRARLEELFAQAPAAIAILSGPNFVYETANSEYLRLVHGRNVVGKPIRDALPELAGQGIFELLERVRGSGEPVVGDELRLMLSEVPGEEPREHFFNFVYQPIFEEAGDVSSVFVHAVDVTDQVIARREAEEANRAKSQFLAAMSHELRTPLNAIAGYAQLIEMGVHGPVTPAQRDAIQRLQRSEQHLLALVNDVLNFAKLEAGRVEYAFDAIDVGSIVDAVRSVIEPQITERGLAYDVAVDRSLSLWADPDKVQQILINLLSNSAKFTPSGGRISIRAKRAEGEQRAVAIMVTDTGIGIPLDRQANVFDPFVQVHRRLTQNTDGTGLGLAISRDLARGMHGELTLVSAEGKGSTFTLTLPADRETADRSD
jgi:signal transduction histidine kinase